MANIIRVGKSDVNLNVFCQPNAPETKQGIWLKSNEYVFPKKVVFDTSVWSEEQWIIPSPVADMNESRRESWGALVNGEIYIFGGMNSGAVWLTTVEAYNPETNTYRYVKPMNPIRRYKVACETVEERIYLIGGALYETGIDTAVMYDPKTDTYQSLRNMPKDTSVEYHGLIDQRIYIISKYSSASKNHCCVYTPATDSYSIISDLPEPRRDGSAAAYGNEIFIFGGLNGNTDLRTAIAYNSITSTYRNLQNVPYDFFKVACTLVGDEIFLFYGSTTLAYSPLSDTYRELPKSNGARRCAVAILDKDRIYCFGGGGSSSQWKSAGCLSLTAKQYTDNPTVIIYYQPKDHTHNTSLLANNLIDYLPIYFKDAMLYINGKVTFPAVYCGDGENWNLIREEQ